jgi:hypothetical protein
MGMWIRKFWPTVLAVVLQIVGAWNFIKWILDWGGRIDVLASTYHDIGGLDAMIGYLLNPPPWLWPIALIVGLVLIWWDVRRHKTAPFPASISPIEIIFDSSNTGQKFWSIEPMRDENGYQIAGSFWEYRALIRNISPKTLRNVKVMVEAIGDLPTRPETSLFDINKKPVVDLDPNCEALVPIRRWFNPPIATGMVGGGAYGPIKMTVSSDDIVPATKLFAFHPENTPMISEL